MRKTATSRPKNIKHRFGTPNPIMLAEQKALVATVDRALASSSNAQVIGRNGEIPLRQFFNRYLPFTLRAHTGHFVSPSGQLSPEVDILILDARYPLLAENSDGSVLAMLHSVIDTIEVKTRMTSRDIKRGWANAITIRQIANEVRGYGSLKGWSMVGTFAIAYRIAQQLPATYKVYVDNGKPDEAGFGIDVLRLPDQEQPKGGELGAYLHFEPGGSKTPFSPLCLPSYTMLSDVYYRMVLDGYYTLADRNWSYDDIGQHIMAYMAWTTCSLQGN